MRAVVVEAEGQPQVIDLRSGTGDVNLELPDSFNATFDLETEFPNGSDPPTIQSGWHLEQTIFDRGGRQVLRAVGKVGDGKSLVRVRTANADIHIRER